MALVVAVEVLLSNVSKFIPVDNGVAARCCHRFVGRKLSLSAHVYGPNFQQQTMPPWCVWAGQSHLFETHTRIWECKHSCFEGEISWRHSDEEKSWPHGMNY